ncbi:MAG: ATP-binding cassette domain-containing protein [Actinobacteria bacterium]|nr:ATP-binding cassette domain-containing protein [Actinomycetota bacterium]
MVNDLAAVRINELLDKYSYAGDFFVANGINFSDTDQTIEALVSSLRDEELDDIGLDQERIISDLADFLERMERLKSGSAPDVSSISILGGSDKAGEPESITLELKVGEVVAVVGPTGSGKSRLLADIECLAQRDTPTGRQILVNGAVPDRSRRFAIENKLVAQLSQNMNFVVDLSVEEFVGLHAESRMLTDVDGAIDEIISCANELAGEEFARSTPLTQLSGGQSRALMIADTALLSVSPIVLIDEIENAGIDRRKAVQFLVKKEKLVLISTHDPVLALAGDKRIVIRNGGIGEVIVMSDEEKALIDVLEDVDKRMADIRNHIRKGGIVEKTMVDFSSTR